MIRKVHNTGLPHVWPTCLRQIPYITSRVLGDDAPKCIPRQERLQPYALPVGSLLEDRIAPPVVGLLRDGPVQWVL